MKDNTFIYSVVSHPGYRKEVDNFFDRNNVHIILGGIGIYYVKSNDETMSFLQLSIPCEISRFKEQG